MDRRDFIKIVGITGLGLLVAPKIIIKDFIDGISEQPNYNRYWVGGSGKWSDCGNWSESPNGIGGASIPTSKDNVYIILYDDMEINIDSIAYCDNMNIENRMKPLPKSLILESSTIDM